MGSCLACQRVWPVDGFCDICTVNPLALFTLPEALEAAKNVLDGLAEWSADSWQSIGKNWNLNIWIDEGQRKATLYPVGDSDTPIPIPLLEIGRKDLVALQDQIDRLDLLLAQTREFLALIIKTQE